MYQSTKIFGCVCPQCKNESRISIEQFILEKAVICKDCKNIFCHWEGNRFPVTVYELNEKIRS